MFGGARKATRNRLRYFRFVPVMARDGLEKIRRRAEARLCVRSFQRMHSKLGFAVEVASPLFRLVLAWPAGHKVGQ